MAQVGAAEQGVVFKVLSLQQGALSLSGLKKFRKFHVPNGTVHSGCTDPNQATTHAFGYCSCKQVTKERYWGQQF